MLNNDLIRKNLIRKKITLRCVMSEEMLKHVSYPVLLSWFNNLYELNQSRERRPGGESNGAQWFMAVKSCCWTIGSCQLQTLRAKSCRVCALSTIRVSVCDLCRNGRLSCLNYANNRWPCYISERMNNVEYRVWTFVAEVLTNTEMSICCTSC